MWAETEAQIVGRLTELLDSSIRVLTADDLSGLTEERMPTPCVNVIYRGKKVSDVRPDGRAAVLNETWMIVAVVSAARRADSSESKTEASDMEQTIMTGLMGWKPKSAVGPLVLQTPPDIAKSQHCLYVPTQFAIKTTVTANLDN